MNDLARCPDPIVKRRTCLMSHGASSAGKRLEMYLVKDGTSNESLIAVIMLAWVYCYPRC